jgi:hypothetical protein
MDASQESQVVAWKDTLCFSGGKRLEKEEPMGRQWEQGHFLEQGKWQPNFERVCVCV